MAHKVFAEDETITADGLNLLMTQCAARFATTAARNAAITAPVIGQVCYVTGTGLQIYAAGSWRTMVPETPIVPGSSYSRYIATSNAQVFTVGTWQRVALGTTVVSSGAWTTSTVSGGTVFTCQIAARYGISAFIRLNTASTASRGLIIAGESAHNSGVVAVCTNTPGTDYWTTTIYGERSFNVGDGLALWLWTNSAGHQAAADLSLPWINIRQIL